jgi:hypothetical protein
LNGTKQKRKKEKGSLKKLGQKGGGAESKNN